jgi:hypothetical protein
MTTPTRRIAMPAIFWAEKGSWKAARRVKRSEVRERLVQAAYAVQARAAAADAKPR